MTKLEAVGHVSLFALLALLWVSLLPGCATSSKAACTDPEVMRLARKVVVPRLATALVCSAEVETQEEVLQCVHIEFEKLRTEAQPLVFQCAIALLGDSVSAVK